MHNPYEWKDSEIKELLDKMHHFKAMHKYREEQLHEFIDKVELIKSEFKRCQKQEGSCLESDLQMGGYENGIEFCLKTLGVKYE